MQNFGCNLVGQAKILDTLSFERPHHDMVNTQYHGCWWMTTQEARPSKSILIPQYSILLHFQKFVLLVLSWGWNLLQELGQYHVCWCPGSLCRQVISSHVLTMYYGSLSAIIMKADFMEIYFYVSTKLLSTNYIKIIETETKWPPFCKQHFPGRLIYISYVTWPRNWVAWPINVRVCLYPQFNFSKISCWRPSHREDFLAFTWRRMNLAWFSGFKHDYIKEVYWSDVCFAGHGPRTSDFHGDWRPN